MSEGVRDLLVRVVLRAGLHLVAETCLDFLRLLLGDPELPHEGEQVPGAMLMVVGLVAALHFFPLLPVGLHVVDELARGSPVGRRVREVLAGGARRLHLARVRDLIAAAIVFAISCSKPTPPTLTPERASLTGMDAQGIELSVELSAANPNSLDLVVNEVTTHIVLDKTRDLGTATLAKAITLPASKTTKLDVPVSLKWADVGLFAQLAATSNAIPYSVDGTLALGGSLVVGVPFHLEGTIPHEQVVRAAVKSLPQPW
jgi:LEA14-like dessication related protein